jgi:hypothetical protein
VSALYRNEWDLNFWREMRCTQSITPGSGGCCVTNWRDEADVTNPNSPPDLGTVCMNVASVAEGAFTRFYVFGPDVATHDVDSKRSCTFAVLNDEKGDGSRGRQEVRPEPARRHGVSATSRAAAPISARCSASSSHRS